MKRIIINTLPLWAGQSHIGVKYAPDLLMNLMYTIDHDKEIINCGADDFTINISDNIQDAIYDSFDMDIYKDNDLLLNFGGDHAISAATIPITLEKYPDAKVVWIDAHADINSYITSKTGNLHGMPLHFATDLSNVNSVYKKLHLENLCYYGIRDVEYYERKIISDNNIKYFSTNHVLYNHDLIIKDIIEWADDKPIHLSIDVDALDPKFFPCTGTTVSNGLNLESVLKLSSAIKNTGNLVAVDIAEFNPHFGSKEELGISLKSARSIIKSLI